MKTIKLFTIACLTVLISLNGYAQKKKKSFTGGLIIKGNTYIQGSYSHNLYNAGDVIVTIVKLNDGIQTVNYALMDPLIEILKEEQVLVQHKEMKSNDFIARSGKFRKILKLNERYIVYIAKEGYKTKSLEISTIGAYPGDVYVFFFDIILQKEEIADYNGEHPVTCIKYNDLDDYFDYNQCN